MVNSGNVEFEIFIGTTSTRYFVVSVFAERTELSSVLHVIMPVCMFGTVQFLSVFYFNSSVSPIPLFLQW